MQADIGGVCVCVGGGSAAHIAHCSTLSRLQNPGRVFVVRLGVGLRSLNLIT